MDIVGASAGLVVAALPMGVIALLVRRTMGSPVLFRQPRPGRNGKTFILYKFRSMRDGEGDDADRLTQFGRFLRSTSLDETPELWNVLRGDMSLVGPRPLLSDYLDHYTPEEARRHEMKPGLTGLSQVEGRNLMDWALRLKTDVEYVNTWTIVGDLRIIARTIGTVLRRSGVSSTDHATMRRLDEVRA